MPSLQVGQPFCFQIKPQLAMSSAQLQAVAESAATALLTQLKGGASCFDGTSLPDGPAWKAARWKGRRDIPTPQPPTAQAGVEADLVGFYTGFLTDWVTTSPVEQRWLPALAAGPKRKPDAALVEQLMGWRLRDHGTYLALEGQPPQAIDL